MPTWLSNGHYLTLGLLLACTVIGIVVAARFRREVDEDLAPPTARDLLDPLEKAYNSGLMHPAEIERVRDSVKRTTTPVAPPTPVRRVKPAASDSAAMTAIDPAFEAHPPHGPDEGGAGGD